MGLAKRSATKASVAFAIAFSTVAVSFCEPAGASSERHKMVVWSKPFLAQLDAYEANAKSLAGVVSAAIQTGSVNRLLDIAGDFGNEATAINRMQNSPSLGLNVDVNKIAVAIQQVGRELLGVDLAIRIDPSDEATEINDTAVAEGRVTKAIDLATQALNTWENATP